MTWEELQAGDGSVKLPLRLCHLFIAQAPGTQLSRVAMSVSNGVAQAHL
jgi:hypothetical protein